MSLSWIKDQRPAWKDVRTEVESYDGPAAIGEQALNNRHTLLFSLAVNQQQMTLGNNGRPTNEQAAGGGWMSE